jgi:hypothetical protein
MTGDTVARKINEYGGAKIILISAFDVDHSLVTELENGSYISEYVLKPVETERLTDLVLVRFSKPMLKQITYIVIRVYLDQYLL